MLLPLLRLLACGAALVAATGAARADTTLQKVRTAGALTCGVVTEDADYGKADIHGGLDDLGSELCKALATAVLGPDAKATIVSFPIEQPALAALAAGKIDVLAGATPSATTSSVYGVSFAPPFFFDGQGFLVNRATGIASLRDLAGRTVCFIAGTENEEELNAVFAARGISFRRFPFEERGEMDAALVTGHCDAVTSDISQLAQDRAGFHARKKDFVILPETITLDPAAPAVRADDMQWAAIVTWTLEALIQAEANGIVQANVANPRAGDDPTLRRLLGADRAAAHALGLADDWAVATIAAFGNWGDIYARAVGPGTDYDLPRGQNALWRDGGLLYPLPLR
jgi:general L-amino acid transport system substrate-binding protein